MQSDAGAPPDWTENVVEEERQGLFDRWLSFYHSDRMEHHDMALHKNGKYSEYESVAALLINSLLGDCPTRPQAPRQ
jgi:hypothetical protein